MSSVLYWCERECSFQKQCEIYITLLLSFIHNMLSTCFSWFMFLDVCISFNWIILQSYFILCLPNHIQQWPCLLPVSKLCISCIRIYMPFTCPIFSTMHHLMQCNVLACLTQGIWSKLVIIPRRMISNFKTYTLIVRCFHL